MISLAPLAARWHALDRLLDQALDLPASARAAWLDGLGADDAPHRDALRELLARQADIETGDFLVAPPALPLPLGDVAPGPAAGDTVGAYRLVEQIGEGGMGTVWLAERADGTIGRRVALKLPRVVWGDRFAERLARERELLATLAHEHIARLYDAGVDSHGRPFLAMEYVEGETLDAWCRTHAPALRERIALLLQAMAAVAHAHSRLVVHRDLKPGNLLVTRDAQVKLLDFGIAKLLEGAATRRTALTELTGRALTPDYASPEQIRGEPLGTASDIYSMAVVAYEVLAGSRPYRLKGSGAAALEQAIAGVEPPLASDAARGQPAARQLRGDLDAILNKALKKAPAERYSTMEAFAGDLQRFLYGAAVEARPDGWAYRAAKIVHRYRLQVGAGAVVAGALVAGTSVALWQAHEARLSADRARSEAARAQVEAATAKAVQGFIESVFNANSSDQADPIAARATTARQLLDRGADRIDKDLVAAPQAQLRLYNLLAQMYTNLALNDRGLALQRRGLDVATRLYGKASAQALDAAADVGQALDDLGRRDDALAVLLDADVTARSRAEDRDVARMKIDTGLAHVYFSADPPAGLARARSAAAIARPLGPSPDGIAALFMLGENARKSGRLEEARQALVDAAAWVDQTGAAGALPDILSSLGEAQDELGQLASADATLARAIALAERVGDPHTLHIARYKRSRFQYENGLLAEALESAGADAAWARALGPAQEFGDLPAVVTVNYGRTLVAHGDAARGLAVLDEAFALLPQKTSDRLGPLLAARADALVSLGRVRDADADLQRAVAATATAGTRIVEAVRAVRRRYLVAVGRSDEALRDLTDHPLPAVETTTPTVLLRRQAEEATLLLAAARPAEARRAALAMLARIDAWPERRFVRGTETRLTAVLGEALLREGRPAEALPVLRKALDASLALYDPVRSPDVARVRVALAEAERRAAR